MCSKGSQSSVNFLEGEIVVICLVHTALKIGVTSDEGH